MSYLASESAVARALRCVSQAVALAVAIATPGIALANPTGASVAHGSAAFATPDAATLNITTSNGAIINWQQFGINPGEVTRFLQQGGSAAVLNRVVGGDPSAILGSLLSNGRVFLINPNGVVFGPNSVVDTAGLVVSTLNMTDDDFINGRLHFEGDGTSGAVVNQGEIRAQSSIILIAPRIENSGLIETAGGGLLLAAGREVTITSFENPEIAYQLQAPENEVVNLGQLITNGGAASVFAGSIRHSGDIDANSVVVGKDGRVQLVASGDVAIEAGSTISANGASGGEILVQSVQGTVMVDDATLSATGDAGRGGDIRVLGEQVGLVGATAIDASGRDGGGQVLIGGDYQGENPQVSNARFTFMGDDVRIVANAGTSGNGGRVILWADDTTRAHGTISAIGGASDGDGGFVEISGKHGLVFQADVDTTAAAGASGTLLLDPDSITIIDGMGGTADGSLPLFTAIGITTIGELALEGQASNVELVAADDIVLQDLSDNRLDMFGLLVGESFTLRTTGTGDIIFNDINDEIFTAGADIILEANGGGDLVLGNITTDGGSFTGGDITLTALSGNVTLNGLVQSGDLLASVGFFTGNTIASVGTGSVAVGKLSLESQDGISLTNANTVEQLTADNASTGNIVFNNSSAVLTLAADGDLSLTTAIENHAAGGLIQITTTGDLNINDLLTSAGNMSLDAGSDIDQLVAGVVTTFVLDLANANTVDLGTANNQVVGLSATNIGNGGLTLNSNSGGSALGLNNINTLSGDIDITNSGGMSVIGTVDAGSSNNITLLELTADVNGAGGTLVGALVDVNAAGGIGNGTVLKTDGTTLSLFSGGSAAAGSIDVEAQNAIASSSVNIMTDSVSTQSVKFVTALGNLTIDSVFGDSGDDYNIRAEVASLLGSSGSVTANTLQLHGAGAITLTGTTSNSTGFTSASFGSGGFNTSLGSVLVSSGGISLVGDGDVNLNSAGIIDLDSPGQNVSINSTNGLVFDGGATGGMGDVRGLSLNISAMNGIELDTDVTNLSVVNATSGNVRVINTTAGAVLNVSSATNSAVAGSIQIENEQAGISLTNASANGGDIEVNISGGAAASDIVVTDIATTGDVRIINQNLNAGSGILQSGSGSIGGTRVLLEMENNVGPATAGTYTIGTAANPIRIADGVQLEAHGHVETVPIFIQGLGDLIIGDGGAGVIEGIDSPKGVIEVSAAGTLTLLGGGMPGHVRSGGSPGDDISLGAGNGIVINAEIDAGTEAVTLDAGAGGAVVQNANGDITAGDLKVTSQDGITLDLASNNVAQLTADNIATGNIDFENSGGALDLSNNGTAFAVRNQAAGGQINIKSISSITLSDEVIATATGNVTLDAAGGPISQTAAGAITGSVLNILNTNAANLSTATNNVIGLSGSGITASGLQLLNDSGGSALALNNISAIGDLVVTNSGGISVTGTVDTGFNDITLNEMTADVNGAGGMLVGSTVNVSAAGGIGNGTVLQTDATFLNLSSGGAAAAGNIDVEEQNAISTSSVTITTDSLSTQSVRFVTGFGNLTIDSAFGDSGDDYNIRAEVASLLGASGTVNANNLTLRGANSIMLNGSTLNAIGFTSGSFGFGGFSTSGGSQLVSGSSISLIGNSNVTLSPGGVIDLDVAAGNVTINLLSGGQVTNGGATGGAGVRDIRADSINLSTTGVDVDVDVSTVNSVSTGAGNTLLINTGSSVLNLVNVFNGSAGGSVVIKNEQNGIALADVNLTGAGGTFDLFAGTLSGSGAITDANGSALNVLADNVSFTAATGIGTVADPIEIQSMTLVGATSSSGSIAIANAGTWALTSNFTVSGGDLFLSGSTGLSAVSRTLNSSGAVGLDGGSGLLLIDGSTITAGTAFSANAAQIDVYSSMINGNTLLLTSSGTTHVTAGSGGPALLSASDFATFNAGTLRVEGGSSTGDSAKFQATNTVTVNATDVIVQGGLGFGAFASIDPTTVVINAANDILVQAGSVSGAKAEIIADNLVNLSAGGNIDIIGDAESAVVESSFGDVVLSALGAVTLIAGTGSNGDAVIAANSGSGAVDITSTSCVNCVLLDFDPFANATADQGLYAAAPIAPAVGGGAAQDEPNDISNRDVLVLEDLAERLFAERRTGDDDGDDDEDQKICR